MQGANYICYLDYPDYREEFRNILKESLKEVLKRFQNLLGRLYKFRMRSCQLDKISQNLESFWVVILSCFCKINFKCISFNHSEIWLNSKTTGADTQGSQSNAAYPIASRDTASTCASCTRAIHHTGTKFQFVFWFSLWDSSRDGVVPLAFMCEEFIPNSGMTLD